MNIKLYTGSWHKIQNTCVTKYTDINNNNNINKNREKKKELHVTQLLWGWKWAKKNQLAERKRKYGFLSACCIKYRYSKGLSNI